MKVNNLQIAVCLIVIGALLGSFSAFAAVPTASLLKAKQEAESQGYIFLTTHDEILAAAKKEDKLRVMSQLSSTKAMIDAFKKRYPFLDVDAEEMKSSEARQPVLLELKSGRGRNWDVLVVAPDLYDEYIPLSKKFDILGMASQKVLAIPPATIDPKNRNIVSIGSALFGIGYNRKLISDEKLPKSWEDFLKPEFKGKKFMADVRPLGFAALAAGLGEKWAVDYAMKIAAQDPVWFRNQSRGVATLAAGEQALLHLVYYHNCMRAAAKDPTGSLGCEVIEPVPARLTDFASINNVAPHPYSSLLWLEFQASPEGQSIINKYEPLNLSIYASDSALAKLIRGKKVSVNSWDTLHQTSKWEQLFLKAFGFPKAD